MSVYAFRFDQQWFQSRMRSAFEPRKPRQRALRIALGLVGVALLAVLVMLGLVVGAVMLGAGLLYRLWKRRGKPIARDSRVINGEFRAVQRQALPR